jgi:hypothetical protein
MDTLPGSNARHFLHGNGIEAGGIAAVWRLGSQGLLTAIRCGRLKYGNGAGGLNYAL